MWWFVDNKKCLGAARWVYWILMATKQCKPPFLLTTFSLSFTWWRGCVTVTVSESCEKYASRRLDSKNWIGRDYLYAGLELQVGWRETQLHLEKQLENLTPYGRLSFSSPPTQQHQKPLNIWILSYVKTRLSTKFKYMLCLLWGAVWKVNKVE